jgi:hypothetical protein
MLRRAWYLAWSLALLLEGCSEREAPRIVVATRDVSVVPLFPGDAHPGPELAGCSNASPLWYEAAEAASVIVAESSGTVSALDPETGALRWQSRMPAPDGEDPYLLATPVIVGTELVVTYHTTAARADDAPPDAGPVSVNTRRLRQRVAVLLLEDGTLDESFPVFDLAAELPANDGGRVRFTPARALSRGSLVHARPQGHELGLVYVTFGNARDIQPWHGWAFELDLDAWREHGARGAVSAVLNTTPETDDACGTAGQSGSRERQCGGGLWSPAGPLVIQDGDDVQLILSAGNGQLDLRRGDFANTLLRVRPGLAFDPGCGADVCAEFDPDLPDQTCLESCRDLFVPRALPGQEIPYADTACAGMTLYECWAHFDFLGGSTPELVRMEDGRSVLVYPGKDGYLYLVDAEHLGTMYDRAQVVESCGHEGDKCKADWAGTIVTKPTLGRADDEVVVLVPSFMPDTTHAAGVVAFDVVLETGVPALRRRWEFPDFASPEARERFRWHPSRVALMELSGEGQIGLIVESGKNRPHGVLRGFRVADGRELLSAELKLRGIRFAQPLVHDDVIYVPSCTTPDFGPSTIEAFRITSR